MTVDLAVVSSGVRCTLVVSEGEQAESRPAIRQIFRRGLQTKRLAGGEQRLDSRVRNNTITRVGWLIFVVLISSRRDLLLK